MQHVWLLLATAPAAVAAGIVGMLVLIFFGAHVDAHKKTSPPKLVSAVLLSIATYTLVVLVTGNFFVNIPLSVLVRDGVGDNRLAWIFVGMAADVFGRYIRLFD